MQASLMVLFGQPPQLQHIVKSLRASPILIPNFLASRTPELGVRLKLAEQALCLLDCILQGSPNGASWAIRVLPHLRDLLSTGGTSDPRSLMTTWSLKKGSLTSLSNHMRVLQLPENGLSKYNFCVNLNFEHVLEFLHHHYPGILDISHWTYLLMTQASIVQWHF